MLLRKQKSKNKYSQSTYSNRSICEIESGDVHSLVYHFDHNVLVGALSANRADNFGLSRLGIMLVKDLLEFDVGVSGDWFQKIGHFSLQLFLIFIFLKFIRKIK